MSSSMEASVPRLQGLLGRLLSRKPLKHAIVAVESGDGSFGWTGAAGEARPDGSPMLATTPFFIASIDKLFTAAVILKLRDSGRLDLENALWHLDYHHCSRKPHALLGSRENVGARTHRASD